MKSHMLVRMGPREHIIIYSENPTNSFIITTLSCDPIFSTRKGSPWLSVMSTVTLAGAIPDSLSIDVIILHNIQCEIWLGRPIMMVALVEP
jgi:hypothetical protein